MLLRLCLALLALIAAPPALAMPTCHAPIPALATQVTLHAAMPAMAGHDRHDRRPASDLSGGLCLGCIAPATLGAPTLAGRVAPSPMPPTAVGIAMLISNVRKPGTPPPRG